MIFAKKLLGGFLLLLIGFGFFILYMGSADVAEINGSFRVTSLWFVLAYNVFSQGLNSYKNADNWGRLTGMTLLGLIVIVAKLFGALTHGRLLPSAAFGGRLLFAAVCIDVYLGFFCPWTRERPPPPDPLDSVDRLETEERG